MDKNKLIGGIVVAIILIAGAFMYINQDTPEELDGKIKYNDEYELRYLTIVSVDGSKMYVKAQYIDENGDAKFVSEYNTDAGYENENVFIGIRPNEDLAENEYKFIHTESMYINNDLLMDKWELQVGNVDEWLKFTDTLNQEKGFEYFEFVDNENGFNYYIHPFFATTTSTTPETTGYFYELEANEEGSFVVIN